MTRWSPIAAGGVENRAASRSGGSRTLSCRRADRPRFAGRARSRSQHLTQHRLAVRPRHGGSTPSSRFPRSSFRRARSRAFCSRSRAASARALAFSWRCLDTAERLVTLADQGAVKGRPMQRSPRRGAAPTAPPDHLAAALHALPHGRTRPPRAPRRRRADAALPMRHRPGFRPAPQRAHARAPRQRARRQPAPTPQPREYERLNKPESPPQLAPPRSPAILCRGRAHL